MVGGIEMNVRKHWFENKSSYKIIKILQTVSEIHGYAISKELGIDHGAIYRHLKELVSVGIVFRNPMNKKYSLNEHMFNFVIINRTNELSDDLENVSTFKEEVLKKFVREGLK